MSSIYGDKAYEKYGSRYWQLRLDYEVVAQSVADNTSTVDMSLYVYDGTGDAYNPVANSAYYTLWDGTRVYKPYHYYSTGWYKLGDRRASVAHGADGTKTVTLAGGWVSDVVSDYTPASLSVSGSVTLPAIPRASALTAPEQMTMGTPYAVTIVPASAAFTHALTWRFFTKSGTVSGGTWTPALSLAEEIPNAESGAGTLTLVTYSGGTEIGRRSYGFTLRCPDSMTPTVTPGTLTPVSSRVPAGWNATVKGLTALQYAVTAAGTRGSTVTGVRFSCGGVTCDGAAGTTAALPAAGTFTPTVTVTDSRGRSAAASWPALEVYDHAPPTLQAAEAFRADGSGVADGSGTFLSVLAQGVTACAVGGHNQVSVYYRLRSVDGAFGAEQPLTNGTALLLHPPLDAAKSYEAQLLARDSLGAERSVTVTIPTAAVAFNLRRGGRGAAFGKYAEHDNALELPAGWDVTVGGVPLARLLYPVGSVFHSDGTVSPAAVFGGTWTELGTASGVTAWRRTE